MHTPPFVDSSGDPVQGSLAEIVSLELGGVTQSVVLRGRSVDSPVLLFLHGGPGTSEFNLLRRKCPELEEIFTVAHWEQRGSGLSYHADIPPESMTLEQLIEDAAQLADYLRQRFGQPKIYVMGHSWGTLLGIRLVHKYPELFLAYIGLGQVAHTLHSEQIGYDWLISRLEAEGDQDNLAKLRAHPRPDESLKTGEQWMNYLSVHRPLCQKHGGGNSHYEEWSSEKVLKTYIETPEYGEEGVMGKLVPGLSFTLEHLSEEFVFVNLTDQFVEFEIPIYILHGIHDYQTTHQIARQYFDVVNAPKKRFFSFEKSAHTPFYDEPERFMSVVREIVEAAT